MLRKMGVIVLTLFPVYCIYAQNVGDYPQAAPGPRGIPTVTQWQGSAIQAWNNVMTSGGTVQDANKAYYGSLQQTQNQVTNSFNGANDLFNTTVDLAAASDAMGAVAGAAGGLVGTMAEMGSFGVSSAAVAASAGNLMNTGQAANSQWNSQPIPPPPTSVGPYTIRNGDSATTYNPDGSTSTINGMTGQITTTPPTNQVQPANAPAQQAAAAAGVVGAAAGGLMPGIGAAPAAANGVSASAAGTALGNAVQSGNAANGVGQVPAPANVAGMVGNAAGGVLPGVSGAAAASQSPSSLMPTGKMRAMMEAGGAMTAPPVNQPTPAQMQAMMQQNMPTQPTQPANQMTPAQMQAMMKANMPAQPPTPPTPDYAKMQAMMGTMQPPPQPTPTPAQAQQMYQQQQAAAAANAPKPVAPTMPKGMKPGMSGN